MWKACESNVVSNCSSDRCKKKINPEFSEKIGKTRISTLIN